MNNGLTAENLLLALPEALRQDEQMQALAAGIAEVLADRPAEIDKIGRASCRERVSKSV